MTDVPDDDLLRVPDEVAVPRPAATTVLVRDGANGIETWMMQRVQAMSFAAGAAVFPGGRVDPRDADITVPWTGSDPDTFAVRFGTDADTARALVTGALRELFEETGVLLAEPLPAIDLEQARVAVESRDLPLARLLADHDCALATGGVHPWARWVTPPVEKRRYDTWFFVVVLPPSVDAAAVSSEADTAGWFLAQDVLDAQVRGDTLVLPPTRAMLEALLEAGTVTELIARAPHRSLTPVHPEICRTPAGGIEVVADGRAYLVQAPPDAAHGDGSMPEPAVAALVDWLNARVDLGLDPSDVVVRRLPGGNSNLTYLLTCGERQWVLRRPPEHGLDASAHSMAREWRLLNALHGSGVPSATPVAYGQDIEVIGAEFLLSAYLPGSVSLTDTLPVGYPPGALEPLGHALVDALASIHSVDWQARGLGDFGRPDGFLDRQVPRWEGQYRRHQVRELPDFDVVTDWLRAHRPVDQAPAVLHGDYHLDNCLFSVAGPELLAVIDWEMATIGDPLLDLGLALAFWGPRTRTPPGMARIQAVSRGAGAPSRTQLAERYADATGRDLSSLRWYLVFGWWKLGAIVEAAWGQHVRGELRTEYAAALEYDVPALFAEAADLAAGAELDGA